MDFQRLGDYLALQYRLKKAIGSEGSESKRGEGTMESKRDMIRVTGSRGVSIHRRPYGDNKRSSRSLSGFVSRSKPSKRFISILMVLVMVFVIVEPLSTFFTDGADYDSESHTVVYHVGAVFDETSDQWKVNLTTGGSIVDPENGISKGAVKYNSGYTNTEVKVTYYGSTVSTEYNPQFWAGSVESQSEVSDWFHIEKYREEETLVFTGWAYGSPWGEGVETHHPGAVMSEDEISAATSGEEIHVYATWGYLQNYETGLASAEIIGGNEYTNIILISGGNNSASLDHVSAPFTIRSQIGQKAILYVYDREEFSFNVIIDNVYLQNRDNESPTNNHGDGHGYGLYARGHTLILGTGVELPSNIDSASIAPQVYGGSCEGTVQGSTDVIIHSGVFYNVVAGGYNCHITGSTNLVMRGGIVLDTVVGGNSGGASSNNVIEHDTNVYMTGDVRLPGDDYEEKQLDELYSNGFTFSLTESTILTGGSNNGIIAGGSNVHISGSAELWDVQGGGRRGESSVHTATVTVSGNALIKHVLCGSITDGLDGKPGHGSTANDNKCVKDVNITIGDRATVASVFGAGYDTYYAAKHASMIDGGTISITIEDSCTVGYVYGGGYRGTIGSAEKPIESISISISGGTVLCDVFGGGRGGVDKILHNTDGSVYDNGSESMADSTGFSKVYVNSIEISVSGGTIRGSIYGGGESVPVLDSVSGGNGYYGNNGVASVVSDSISVSITGGHINGDVFGSGKGIVVEDGVVKSDKPAIYAIDRGSTEIVKIEWYDGSDSLSYDATQDATRKYTDYASMITGELSISIDGEGTASSDARPEVGNSVYGGGMAGVTTVNGDVTISIKDSTVKESVYGGGMGDSSSNTGSVTINESGSLTIAIVDGSDIGSLYGGGAFGKLESTGPADLSVSGVSTKIRGDVYGGGKNSAFSVDSMKLTIESSDIDGDVYGGGMYGLFESNIVDINLTGVETTIGGSVYGGGLGTKGELATVVSERTIVINGPTILGSVYGGSRDGDDNYVDSGNGYGSCTTNIYILSGNISSGSSGNVYGGAYKGRSKMDSNIYVGSAVPEQIGYPVERVFSIHSIFGGASVGQVDDDYETSTKLLFGNTNIRIGGEGYTGSITGNVFGEGDYCRISGSANIEFIGFSNPSGVSMLSIQKADSVTLKDTELVLNGDVDGNSTSGSAKLSINDVGMLTIVGHGPDARSGLTMNAQVSALSGYESVHEVEFTNGDKYLTNNMNYLHLNGGKMFSVLGENNDGKGMGTAVSGATVLIRDDNPYYGALAISGPSIDSTAAFVLKDGTEAGMTVYDYGGVDVTVWYIAGAFTVDETVTLVSGIGNSVATISDIATIGIPKMVSGSVIEYVGHYTSMSSEGSLNVVDSLENTTAGEDFMVMLGTEGGSIQYEWEKDGSIQYGLNLASAESGTQFQGSGATIGLSISTNSPFAMTGYAGTIHIHMVEVYGGITIGTFDIEVAVFLSIPQPDEGTYTISQDLLVKDYGDNKHEGTTDVYLPVLDGGAVGTYTLLSVSRIPVYDGVSGSLTMSLESTYLNKSGWLTRLWDGGSLENSTSYNAVLGDGGLFSPVLGFDFTCSGHDNPDSATEWDPIIIMVQVVWTDGGDAKSQIYEIVLTPKHASERAVSFYDKWLSSDGTYTWQYLKDEDNGIRLPSFTLSVEFGDSLAGLYIAIKETDLKNAISKENWSVEYYLSHFQEYLYCNDEGHAVTARSADEILEAAGTGYVAYPVYSYEESRDDILDVYQNLKREVVEDSEEGYLKNIRWFDNPTGPAEFNFYSQVTDEGLSLYVGYGVILTFKAEVKGDVIGNDGIWVSPSTMFLEDLSTFVDFGEIGNSLRVTAGYKIIGFKDSVGNNITNTEMRILDDTTITVILEAESYTLDIIVKDEKGNLLYSDGVSSDLGIQITPSPEDLHFGQRISITITYNDQQYRILGAEGKYGNFTFSEFTFTQDKDNTYSVCEFQMPNGNLELTITLSEGYSLTVSIPESSPHTDDNHLFDLSTGADGGFTVSLGGVTDEVILNLRLNAQKTIAFTMPSTYDGNAITISIGSVSGAYAEIQGNELKLTQISDDVSVELTIHVEWKLTVYGSGYTVSKNGIDIVSGGTVHTGDVLTLMTLPGYSFDVRPTVTGANITSFVSETVVMTVSGTGNVTITGDAVRHSVIVTVVIDFRNQENTPDVNSIIGVATVGGIEAEVGKVTLVDGIHSFTVEVLSGAQFSVTATVDGYIVSVYTGSSDEDVEVIIHAAQRTTAEGPQEATGSLTISTVSDRVNGTYTVADVDGLGKGKFTFGDRTVTIGDGNVILSGFDGFVGTMVLYSYEMGTLTIVSYPVTVGA